MKRILYPLATLLIGSMIFLFSGSCKHEILNVCMNEPMKIIVTKTDASPAGNDGIITITADGPGKYTYSLNGSAFQTDSVFRGLAASKNYKLVVLSPEGCSDSATIDLNTYDPCNGVAVSLSVSKTNTSSPSASDGSISLSASGGTGFTYSLNGGSWQSSGNFPSLAAGVYAVTARNAEGCSATSSVTIGTNDPCAGVVITVSLSKTDPSNGSNGSISATASGSSNLSYSLNGGAYQTSGLFSNLAAGSYTVTAKTAAGCSGTATIALNQPNACNGVSISVTLSKTDPTSGANGTISVTASGASGFTYSLNGGAYQSSATFSGLASGAYTVMAKSSGGCTGSAAITLNAANACAGVNISITSTTTAATPCTTAGNNGTITLTAAGSSGFTYNLNGGAYQSANTFTGLAAGTYTVGVKDANGCTGTSSVQVSNVAAGPQYAAVKSLIQSACGGCHTNGGSSGGYNFDTDCNIINNYSQIQSAAVTRGNMPPGGPLSAANQKIITDWVNGGHGYSN